SSSPAAAGPRCSDPGFPSSAPNASHVAADHASHRKSGGEGGSRAGVGAPVRGLAPLPEVDLATRSRFSAELASGSKIIGDMPVSEATDTLRPGLGTPPPAHRPGLPAPTCPA